MNSKLKAIFFYLFILFNCTDLIAQNLVTHSVVVGGVTSTSARFFIRAQQAGFVNVELSRTPSFENSIGGNPEEVNADNIFSAIVNISGLEPDTKYYYRVKVNSEVETSARSFFTFPEQGSNSTFVFGFGSCQQNGGFLEPTSPPGNIYLEIIKHEPRFFLQIGDWGYPDSTDNAPYNNNFFPVNYSAVQQIYLNKYDPEYPMDQLFRIAPVDYLYDDHDFMNNNSSATTSSYPIAIKPNEFGNDYGMIELQNPANARENSIRGYKEYFPGYEMVNESRGIYHKFSFGNADFFMVDLRSQRSPNLEAFVKNETTALWEFKPSASHSILGRDASPGSGENQFEWFLREIKNSTAAWKFIVSPVIFNMSFRKAINLSMLIQDSPLDFPEAPPGTNAIVAAMELVDKWAGFPADQDSILKFVKANNIKNVIVLSGDAHTAAMDDGTNAGFPEVLAGGLDITNSQIAALLDRLSLKIWNKGGQGLSVPSFNNAFGKVTVYNADSVNLSLIDEYSTLIASYTIKNTSTGIDESKSDRKIYQLGQNYPNPFNPSTNFRYRIGELSFVQLKIFDAIGNEIVSLVNKELPAGEYNLNFDGRGLASGVYFYQLKAGSFLETKKFILLR